jgi:hypothetical protein
MVPKFKISCIIIFVCHFISLYSQNANNKYTFTLDLASELHLIKGGGGIASSLLN